MLAKFGTKLFASHYNKLAAFLWKFDKTRKPANRHATRHTAYNAIYKKVARHTHKLLGLEEAQSGFGVGFLATLLSAWHCWTPLQSTMALPS
jgi:hypothetical protein